MITKRMMRRIRKPVTKQIRVSTTAPVMEILAIAAARIAAHRERFPSQRRGIMGPLLLL